MTNGDNGAILIREIIHRAAEIYGWDDVQPPVKRAVALTEDALQAFAGTYAVTEPMEATATLSVAGEALVLEADGFIAGEPFLAQGENAFFSLVGSDLVFTRDDAGAVTGFEYRGFVKATKTD